jgi:hypothetical protein
MKEDFEIFKAMLQRAAANIGHPYFLLPVAGAAEPIYRERVYCYELYHQLRVIWKEWDFSLCGEIDKSGHGEFSDGSYPHAKPDYLVHRAGDMERNLACVEVKPCVRPWNEFREDLRQLTWFCRNARYHRGVFLIYGTEVGETETFELIRAKLRRAADNPDVDHTYIQILHHRRAGGRPEGVTL